MKRIAKGGVWNRFILLPHTPENKTSSVFKLVRVAVLQCELNLQGSDLYDTEAERNILYTFQDVLCCASWPSLCCYPLALLLHVPGCQFPLAERLCFAVSSLFLQCVF